MNKKAMFFTLISVVLVVAIIAFFMPNYENYSYMSRVPTLKTRFVKANTFVSSMYGDIGERALAHSSYNALRSLNEYINISDEPLANLQGDFTTVLLNGTIGGADLTSYGINYMRNGTMAERIRQFEQMADSELGLRTNLSITGVRIYQSDETGYDRVAVELNLSMQLESGIASWNTTKTITTFLFVDRFDDPYYIMNQGYRNRISFTNISSWNTSIPEDVFFQIESMRYAYEPAAPNFLMRFVNDSSNSSCCGMESLINPMELGITNTYLSYADYCFYGRPQVESCGYPGYALFNFTHLTSDTSDGEFYGFKLELYHTNKYNLTGDIR
jgi:hypothetical protein